MKNEKLHFFLLVLIAVFFAVKLADFDTREVAYKVDFVNASSTETFADYLNRQGDAGWDLWAYKDYSDGREYIFKR